MSHGTSTPVISHDRHVVFKGNWQTLLLGCVGFFVFFYVFGVVGFFLFVVFLFCVAVLVLCEEDCDGSSSAQTMLSSSSVCSSARLSDAFSARLSDSVSARLSDD